MMKRALALALALLVLLTLAAGAETESSIIELSGLKLTYDEAGSVSRFDFPNLRVDMAVGLSGQIPSLQLTFANDEGQELGAVVQVLGSEVLGSVGSVTSVFSVDLGKVIPDPGTAAMVTMALGSAVSLGNISLEGLILAVTTEGENGARVLRADVPTAAFARAADNALSKAEGFEAAQDLDFGAVREKLHGLKDTLQAEFSYNPGKGTFSVSLAQDDKRLSLSGAARISSAPFAYADIDLEANRIDVMNMTDADIAALNDEMSLMAGRLINQAVAVGLTDLIPAK